MFSTEIPNIVDDFLSVNTGGSQELAAISELSFGLSKKHTNKNTLGNSRGQGALRLHNLRSLYESE